MDVETFLGDEKGGLHTPRDGLDLVWIGGIYQAYGRSVFVGDETGGYLMYYIHIRQERRRRNIYSYYTTILFLKLLRCVHRPVKCLFRAPRRKGSLPVFVIYSGRCVGRSMCILGLDIAFLSKIQQEGAAESGAPDRNLCCFEKRGEEEEGGTWLCSLKNKTLI
jgi:hypothetical protein